MSEVKANVESSGFDISIEPDINSLRIFKNMSFTPWFSLGEFIDNSITSALKNFEDLKKVNGADYKLRISIEFPPGSNSLVIKDNAAGISTTEMQRALRTGVPPEDTSVGLSKHGYGMKAAAFWWGAKLRIKTYPLGSSVGWQTTIHVPAQGDIQAVVHVQPVPWRGFPGTEITVSDLWRNTPHGRTIGTIKSYLPSIYRAFLTPQDDSENSLMCSIEYQGQELQYEYPKLLVSRFWPNDKGPDLDSVEMEWRSDFQIKLSTGKSISGWYGILERMKRDQSGFFLHYRGKGISGVVPMATEEQESKEDRAARLDTVAKSAYKPSSIFGQRGSHADQVFIGEFDVSDFGKTISTDSSLWTDQEREEFDSALYADMKDKKFLAMARNFRRREKSKEDEEDIADARSEEPTRIAGALTGVTHIEGSELPEVPYPLPDDQTSDSDAEFSSRPMILRDQQDHEHEFSLLYVHDASANFITIHQSPDSKKHRVVINRGHRFLDDVPYDAKVDRVISRIAICLAAAEVFLSLYGRQQIRLLMNDYLQRIGSYHHE